MAESGALKEKGENPSSAPSQPITEHWRPRFVSFACALVVSAADRSSRTTLQGAVIGSIPGGMIGIAVAIAGAIYRGAIADYAILAAFALLTIGIGGMIVGAVTGAALGWTYGVIAGFSEAFRTARREAQTANSPAQLAQSGLLTRRVELLGQTKDAVAGVELACGNQEKP